MSPVHHFGPRMADVGTAVVLTVAATAAMNIEVINHYLQAGAFIVAMISGSCAAAYYLVQIFRSKREK